MMIVALIALLVVAYLLALHMQVVAYVIVALATFLMIVSFLGVAFLDVISVAQGGGGHRMPRVAMLGYVALVVGTGLGLLAGNPELRELTQGLLVQLFMPR